jgi:iron complex transport system substrate-binding protein
VNAPATAALAPGTVGVSYENVSMLDGADGMFITFAGTGDQARFEGSPLVQQLRAVRGGTFMPLTLDQAVALQAPNVVAVDWLLGQLRPTLEKMATAR